MSWVSDLIRPAPARPPEAMPDEASLRGSGREEALRLIEEADVLGIPWREVLKREISAEGTLQRFLGSSFTDLPLWRALSIIPSSLFHSWRVRELVDRLCYEAATEGSRPARREIASLLECLSGPRARKMTAEMTLARHYWFAYQRILELQSVALAAERSRASGARGIAQVCDSTGCSRRDAEWAVARWTSESRSHALDDAVLRARREGFEIPGGATELQAFRRLKRFVSRHRVGGEPQRSKKTVSVRTIRRDDAPRVESDENASSDVTTQ
jgi:hypothetical protein